MALGNLQEKIEHNECKVLSTSTIGQFVETFEWQGVESYPILQAVYGLLVEWLLKSDQISVRITTDSVTEFVLHPVPADSGDGVLVDFWREEIGKVYEIHKRHCGVDYCIGVACDFAFGNYPKGDYLPPIPEERFPLVGPSDLSTLMDIEEWDVPAELNAMPISYSNAKKNIKILNGIVADSAEGSHYKVTFPGAARPWPLDFNIDPVPDRFISQLPILTGFPESVVRFALIYGELPGRKRRL